MFQRITYRHAKEWMVCAFFFLVLQCKTYKSYVFFTDSKSQFTKYRSWNTQMYPVWKDGDARFRNCWSGEALFLFLDPLLITPPEGMKLTVSMEV